MFFASGNLYKAIGSAEKLNRCQSKAKDYHKQQQKKYPILYNNNMNESRSNTIVTLCTLFFITRFKRFKKFSLVIIIHSL